ncbi:coiled-coil domain-containing protein 57 isoform X2 [Corythoichthys intestinalis]|uniref:coiled-coil domain-containing protein 57 isoform X2 n=1 Tax=Corythoichthys intestinalis TaxID=161448 RepID=UPI0025A6649B|nr:coiled-coil domain-containing protein 57 isoform X2 [Corythoichthys intestinalis]
MQTGGVTQNSGLGDLEVLLANKEREWKELHARRVNLLEDSLKKAQDECSSLRQQYQKLKEDFQYNLSILDEQEKELQKYDVITSRALNAEQSRQEELSRLRIQVAVLEEKQAKDAEARQEELHINQNKAAQQRLQLDELRHSMTDTIEKQMEEHERMKLEFQHRVHEMEDELTRQKEELTATWEKKLRQREHQFNLKLDEMHAVLLSNELKIKCLSKECEVQSKAREQETQALKASEELCEQLHTQLQHKADLNDETTAVKDVRIKELEHQLKWMESKLEKQRDDHIRKQEDDAQALKEKDKQMGVQYEVHLEQLKRAEKQMIQLQNSMKIQSAKACSTQKDMEMALEQKNDTIKRLRTDVTAAQATLEKYMCQTSHDMVTNKSELIILQNSNNKLRAELERSRDEINRYKQDISAGLKREAALEQARIQLELEWQKRCDATKAKHYLANEQLIQDLTQARDQAELQQKEKELHDLTVLLPSVENQTDKAGQCITPKPDTRSSEEISSLVEQNNFLRAVVSQMRRDMEDLGHLLPHPQTEYEAASPKMVEAPDVPPATPTTEPLANQPDITATNIPTYLSDYTQGLKKEMSLLNERCRHIEEQLQGAPAIGTPKNVMGNPHDSTSLAWPNAEPDHTNVRFQSSVVQQVQDRHSYLWQQQQHLNSALMAGAASSNVQGIKKNIVLSHARLKQAAFYIARLSREKQQLIQIGNCLRAAITSAGLQETIERKKDDSKVEQRHQHERLSALEKLQYRLTTQELQYAARQKACTVAKHANSTNSRRTHQKGDRNPCSRVHQSTDETGTSKTATSSQQQSSELKTQPSSEESLQSLKGIWEILDHGLSSSIHSEGDSELIRSKVTKSGTGGVMVTGTSAPIHRGSSAKRQQKKNPTKAPSNPPKSCKKGTLGKISRIRNYNAKD